VFSSHSRVTPDFTLEREGIFRVYAMIGAHDPSLVKMNEWMNGSPDGSGANVIKYMFVSGQ
jgi:hypothetical protein